MKPLQVLAAGSLRHVWPAIVSAFQQDYPAGIETQFGPAGLLRQRIEQKEACDLFVSASTVHPQALLQAGLAQQAALFCHNFLCLSVRRDRVDPAAGWLDLLRHTDLRVATSTPGCDPCGDYAWQLLDRIEQQDATLGKQLKLRARMLVGGRDSPPVPPGKLASAWLIQSGQTDIFIGYRSYAHLLQPADGIITVLIPEEWQTHADYGYAVCQPEGNKLAERLGSSEGQAIFVKAGFTAIEKQGPGIPAP
ncbi:substrate-binding domain-containing protein [Erwinia sorbitola]|uniref:Molybdenum ABC transporter substrate-binding protein n=1 Tax=Erwinia sorbitola TaxID=2681984 RepID=A0ABW9REJ9_9GAMM|nr:substrate-binding domain-containing protein [Erwinia sorbitola]MTD28437.1 molybdenum ABC transporter substrate-binding protein [Erwinia sorbitola]